MHAVRRAAFRAASSSLAAANSSRLQLSSLAMQASRASVRPAVTPMTRYFSQSVRMAEDEKAIVDEATKLAQASEEQNTVGSAQPSKGIYISNMTWDAGENHLREAFAKFGSIEDISVSRDQQGKSRGFGFVTFSSTEAAQAAVEECNQSFWHGRRIRVEMRKSDETRGPRTSGPRPTRNTEPSRSLYIGNIPYETSDADLNKLFRDMDKVVDVRVAVDRNTGWPRGFAHADFADIESATAAYEKISRLELGGRPLRVDYSQAREGQGRKRY